MFYYNEQMRTVIPDAAKYLLDFSFHDCEEILTGCCPVIQFREEILRGADFTNHSSRCVKIMSAICREGFCTSLPRSERIRATWNPRAGLYYVDNGRHRICGASRLHIPIQIFYAR